MLGSPILKIFRYSTSSWWWLFWRGTTQVASYIKEKATFWGSWILKVVSFPPTNVEHALERQSFANLTWWLTSFTYIQKAKHPAVCCRRFKNVQPFELWTFLDVKFVCFLQNGYVSSHLSWPLHHKNLVWKDHTCRNRGKSVEIQAMKFFQITSSQICSMCPDLQEIVTGVCGNNTFCWLWTSPLPTSCPSSSFPKKFGKTTWKKSSYPSALYQSRYLRSETWWFLWDHYKPFL